MILLFQTCRNSMFPPMTHDQPDLFASSAGPAAPVDVAPQAANWTKTAERLPDTLRMGTSSWSFPGWAGLVYDRDAPPGLLSRHGLTAYARHPLLRAVGVDRSYYEAPPKRVFADYARQVPDDFRFMVKAQRDLLTPGHPKFLDAEWAKECIIEPTCAGLGHKLGTLLLQFAPLRPGEMERHLKSPRHFAERLYRFMTALTPELGSASGQRPALTVELRTPALFTEDYAQALHHAGATHGYVVHPSMLTLEKQAALIPVIPPTPVAPASSTTPPLLIRWMLAPGARYEAAKEAWAPFTRMQQPDPSNRRAITYLLKAATHAGRQAMLIVNNKAEGSSPESIAALATEWVDGQIR